MNLLQAMSTITDQPTLFPPPQPSPRPQSPWQGIVRGAALILAALIVGLAVGSAFGREATPVPSMLALTRAINPAARATAAPTTDPAQAVAAVKAVIQKANDEQVKALATGDPTIMQDTTTAQHYGELLKINADLTGAGITAIKLVKLEWGPVDVSGSTAHAVTYETWRSTFPNGTVDQSRDENDYTLVLQGNTWLVSADDHPTSNTSTTTGRGTPGSPSGNGSSVPPVGPGTTTSANWAGYAATGGRFTSVTGTWTVSDPKTTTDGVDATWVGIGGVTSHDLIQAGTETTVSGGSAEFAAWIEMLPQYQQIVPLAVSPGDSVTVSITQQKGGSWLIAMKDNTTGGTYSTTAQYASTLSSAEWVEEAPSGGRRVLPLDDFGTVSFTAGGATKDGKLESIAAAGGRPMTMINGARQPLAQPSPLGSDGASFSVTRTAASSTSSFGPGGFPGRTRGG